MDIKNLSLEEKIGQMFLVGYEANTLTNEFKKFIQNYKIGGIILYRKQFIEYKDLLKLINELKEINRNNPLPLFISVDQEGGRVTRLPQEFKKIPAPFCLAKSKDINLIKNASKLTSTILKETGYNMNFAPVLDIKNFEDTHPIGDRCYGDNVENVCKFGITAMKEFQNNNIIPVIKHFPGHGATNTDSHFFLPIIKKEKEILEKEDMLCFKNAINNGADAIMVGHLLATKVDKFYPASLSPKFIKNILREEYKYNGLVITDSFKMYAIKLLYGDKKAIKRAILAGNDIIMLKYPIKKEIRCIDYIKNLVLKNIIPIEEINNSVKRIIGIKEKYKLNNEPCNGIDVNFANSLIEEINKSANS